MKSGYWGSNIFASDSYISFTLTLSAGNLSILKLFFHELLQLFVAQPGTANYGTLNFHSVTLTSKNLKNGRGE